jgi:hypothetical protein
MCMITDRVAETIRGTVTDEATNGKHRTMPQIVFNLNFFVPGMAPFQGTGPGTSGTLLTQGGTPINTQGGSHVGV